MYNVQNVEAYCKTELSKYHFTFGMYLVNFRNMIQITLFQFYMSSKNFKQLEPEEGMPKDYEEKQQVCSLSSCNRFNIALINSVWFPIY